QALRELARRTALPDVGRFVNAVIQADTLGVGLAKVLQDQALELRTKRRQRAEELARLAPVKMMFPMVLLIFPALFLVILGAAVRRRWWIDVDLAHWNLLSIVGQQRCPHLLGV